MAKMFTIAEGLENLGALRTGGQGSVYKAKRVGEIITAVKILPTPVINQNSGDKNFADFTNEVAKLKKVNEQPNPHVVRILGSGITETGAFPFIEMELIEGPDLEELIKPPHDPVFSVAELIKLTLHLSGALAHCHKAGVKHGDVKSNNVKYNLHTGNYVLLDFGLAIANDEQRRTSLRQAGAIEFMAPEQYEGHLTFASDVYSFGVILFELIAGRVPFPLHDKSETARNKVRLAHLETPLPDVLHLRQQCLPEEWSEKRKAEEMLLPKWILAVVEKCLQKNQGNRFADGAALQGFILQQKERLNNTTDGNTQSVVALREENKKLLQEKEVLHKSLSQRTTAQSKTSGLLFPLLFLLGGIALGYAAFSLLRKNKKEDLVAEMDNSAGPAKQRVSIGQFKVAAARAYFYTAPDEATKRKSYLIPSNDIVSALDERNGFIYTEFTNSRGQTSKGWVQKTDLVTLDAWMEKNAGGQNVIQLRPEDVKVQMDEAQNLMAQNNVKEAVYLYSYLAKQNVAEAMYEYGNLAIQKKHTELSCSEGFEWINKAAAKGFAPAKRTLGFLYIFADNPQLLDMNDYGACNFQRNVYKGSQLLAQAMLAGDSTAAKLLRQLQLPAAADSTD